MPTDTLVFTQLLSSQRFGVCLKVQRVPSNSTRLHTSAASVVVMMEADEMDVDFDSRLAQSMRPRAIVPLLCKTYAEGAGVRARPAQVV